MQITPRLFAGLTVAAGLSLVAAGIVYATSNPWSVGEVTGTALFPSLKTRANDVATIELTQGEEKLVLARQGDGWVSSDRGGYPVRTRTVRRLIVRLAEAELIEPKTRNPERYELLELDDPDKKDAKARRVRLLGKDGGVIAQAVLGRKRWDAFGTGRSGTYVRKPDDPQSWLASLDVDATPEIKGWVATRFFSTDAARVRAVTLEHPGEEALKIARVGAEKNKFRIEGLPADAKLKEDGPALDGVVKGFAGIELVDLRKLDMAPAGSGVSTARLETDDGLTVVFRLRKQKGDNWLSLTAEGTGEAVKKAGELNARVKGWEFKIPSWKADTLFRHRSDFLKTS